LSKQDVRWEYQGFKFVANQSKMSMNLVRHNLDFRDTSHLFVSSAVHKFDAKHSQTEHRFSASGYLKDGRPAMVGYARRGQEIRLFTARYLDRQQERQMIAGLRADRIAQQEPARNLERLQRSKQKPKQKERNRDIKERNTWKRRDNVKGDKNKDLDR